MTSTAARTPPSVSTSRLSIKRVPIDCLHQDPANARLHGSENMDAIEGSLRRFGQAEPLVVQAGTGRVIGGNGRLSVMKKLGWTECDVVELDLEDIQATALGIALNRTGELGSWDEDALGKLLKELRIEDAIEGVGYTPEDINKLLGEIDLEPPPTGIDDPGPEEPPEAPVTRLGDLWALGNHRILCGDSTKSEDIIRLMQGETAMLLSTDPPYCVDYTGNDRPSIDGKQSGKDWTHVYREVDIADLGTFLDSALSACLPVVDPHAAIYVWHAHVQQPVIAATFEKHGLLLHQILVWVKPTATFGHSYYRWRHEPCAFGWRKGNKPEHGYGSMDTVWEADWDGKQRITSFHPTSKPTRLFEIPMEQHTKPGAIVLEPFSGSGSQIIAAEKLGRRCRAMEITPAFVDGTISRWEHATGKKAILEATKKTFEEVRGERQQDQK
jgi:DNA modification methylase